MFFILAIILFIAFSIVSVVLALAGGLAIGIFPATFFAIRNYIVHIRGNVTNKGLLIAIHITFYLFITALLVGVGILLYMFISLFI